jgi:hypothetical protein
LESQKLSFTLEWKTTNTIRYVEDTNGEPPAVGTLYIQKWLLGNQPPRKLTITITGDYGENESASPSSAEDKLWDRILQRTGTNAAGDDRESNPTR